MRAILSVVGPHSGSGKTTFVAHLLRRVSGLGTLKISPARDWPEMSALPLERVGEDFYLEDPAHIAQSGKDTALYAKAGAEHVERLRHRGSGLAAGLDVALGLYPVGMPVVVESSRAVPLLNPVAVVLVVRPPLREMKPTTEAILGRVTDLLINGDRHDESAVAEARRLRQSFPLLKSRHTWFADLIREPPPAEMVAGLKGLLEAGSSG